MAIFTVGAVELGPETEIDFADFISITMGLSIKSAGDFGKDRFEFGLSGDIMLRIWSSPDGLRLNLFSTTNKGEIPPLILTFADEKKPPTLESLERRLKGMRQLYAIIYLFQEGRTNDLSKLLGEDPNADIEHALLKDNERLQIESFGPGSWVIALLSQIRSSYKAILKFAAIIYPQGRDAFLRRLEAETRLKEIEVEKNEFELIAQKTDYALGLAEKLPDPQIKEKLYQRVEREMASFLDMPTESPAVKNRAMHLLGPRVEEQEHEESK
jgi:hypothetical protein